MNTKHVRKAMILAAGKGERLRPFTLQTPKVLLPIAGVPLLQYSLSWLRYYGIEEVMINLNHLGEKVMDFIGDGSLCGIKVHYSTERDLLGTAGGVKNVEDFFSDTFAVLYGDMFTNLNLASMIELHRCRNATATIALMNVSTPWEFGIVQTQRDGKVCSFIEKPPRQSHVGKTANAGVYVLEKNALDHIPKGTPYDFAFDVFPKLITQGVPIYGYIVGSEEYITDIGSVSRYSQINQEVETKKIIPPPLFPFDRPL